MVIRGAEVLCEDYRFRQKDVGMEDGIFVENGRGTVEDASGCYAVPGPGNGPKGGDRGYRRIREK